jgi:hypothetical protein
VDRVHLREPAPLGRRLVVRWPALTGAVSLPGLPASADLPAGGPDPRSNSPGAAFTALAALIAALLLLGPWAAVAPGPTGRAFSRAPTSPLVSPA